MWSVRRGPCTCPAPSGRVVGPSARTRGVASGGCGLRSRTSRRWRRWRGSARTSGRGAARRQPPGGHARASRRNARSGCCAMRRPRSGCWHRCAAGRHRAAVREKSSRWPRGTHRIGVCRRRTVCVRCGPAWSAKRRWRSRPSACRRGAQLASRRAGAARAARRCSRAEPRGAVRQLHHRARREPRIGPASCAIRRCGRSDLPRARGRRWPWREGWQCQWATVGVRACRASGRR